jgi:hypothetical protein
MVDAQKRGRLPQQQTALLRQPGRAHRQRLRDDRPIH